MPQDIFGKSRYVIEPRRGDNDEPGYLIRERGAKDEVWVPTTAVLSIIYGYE